MPPLGGLERGETVGEIKLLLPSNWDDSIIAAADPALVDSLYAKAASDEFGGGRPAFVTASAGAARIVEHIAAARKKGLGFTYLLNASCLGNREFSGEFQKKLFGLVDHLAGAGVTGITAADPVLAGAIIKKYPSIRVGLSLFSMVSSVDQARRYEDLGVSSVLLSNPNDFRLIASVRGAVSCRIILLANLGCSIFCNEGLVHSYFDSHSSQSCHRSCAASFDHHRLMCSIKKIADPASTLKTMYVRPEDVYLYRALGVDRLKIVDRSYPAPAIIEIYRRYADGYFEGNFLSLVNPSNYINSVARSGAFVKAPAFNMFVDNTALCGMKEEIMKRGVECSVRDCPSCGICEKYFRKAASYSEESRLLVLGALRSELARIASSGVECGSRQK